MLSTDSLRNRKFIFERIIKMIQYYQMEMKNIASPKEMGQIEEAIDLMKYFIDTKKSIVENGDARKKTQEMYKNNKRDDEIMADIRPSLIEAINNSNSTFLKMRMLRRFLVRLMIERGHSTTQTSIILGISRQVVRFDRRDISDEDYS